MSDIEPHPRSSVKFFHYRNNSFVASVDDVSMVPTVGAYISIRKEVWKVVRVTYAIDYADVPRLAQLRANVDVKPAGLRSSRKRVP